MECYNFTKLMTEYNTAFHSSFVKSVSNGVSRIIYNNIRLQIIFEMQSSTPIIAIIQQEIFDMLMFNDIFEHHRKYFINKYFK